MNGNDSTTVALGKSKPDKLYEWKVDVSKIGEIVYNVCQDKVEVNEKLYWLPRKANYVAPQYNLDTLLSWKKVISSDEPAAKKSSQEKFADTSLYLQLHRAQSALKGYKKDQLQNARLRANTFENIRHGGIFMNRAAMKMANLDAILDFQLTDPNSRIPPHLKPLVERGEPLYFADICAGPGGFSEYFLWRKKWKCKGIGFTLKGDYDFDLTNFVTGTDYFTAYYGDEGNGDINNPKNVASLIKFIYANTDNKGVHIVTADGGIDFGDQKAFQEVLTKDLLLSQVLVALSALRPGGHFVCKSFELFTPFSIGLVYLLSTCFSRLCIHKPNTSRPANSERYLICQYKNRNVASVQEYLRQCHADLWQMKSVSQQSNIEELVDINVLKSDPTFFEYIVASNNRLAIRQILGLQKLLEYVKDESLLDPRQQELKEQSMNIWNVHPPEEIQARPTNSPTERFNEIKGNCSLDKLCKPEIELSSHESLDQFKSPYDWRIVIVGGCFRKRGLYFSFDNGVNLFLDQCVWRYSQYKFNLPKDTVVYGELVEEFNEVDGTKTCALHIIDGLILGGEDIRHFHYNERHAMCCIFVKSLSTNDSAMPIRMKRFIRMENFKEEFDKSVTKRESDLYCVSSTIEEAAVKMTIKVTGLVFLKITADPWMMAFSRKGKAKYWFDTMKKISTFNLPGDAVADFISTATTKSIWILGHSIEESKKVDKPQISTLSSEELESHVQTILHTVTTE